MNKLYFILNLFCSFYKSNHYIVCRDKLKNKGIQKKKPSGAIKRLNFEEADDLKEEKEENKIGKKFSFSYPNFSLAEMSKMYRTFPLIIFF